MPYKITYRNEAAAEYADAINWYAERSKLSAERFIAEVNEKLYKISQDPTQYRNSYKRYYETNLQKFPFIIVYVIEEPLQRVIIMAVHHYKRHPRKKYRK